MTKNIKRSCFILMALMSLLLCLFASGTPFMQVHSTVYAEDESSTKKQGYSLGDSGDDIKWIQESLNLILGTDIPVDGVYGEQTEQAVKEFQGQHGMKQSGIANSNTMELLRLLRKKAEKSQPATTSAATEENDTSEDEVGKAFKEQTGKPPIEIKKHLFRSYWSEYFATLKNMIFHFGTTVKPLIFSSLAWLGICCVLILFYAIFAFQPHKRILYVDKSDNILDIEDRPAHIIGSGCLFRVIGIITLLSVLIAPFKADIIYIRSYSASGWPATIITAVFWVIIKIILGLIAGALVLFFIFKILRIISDEFAALAGLIAGGTVFLMIYIIPVIMTASI